MLLLIASTQSNLVELAFKYKQTLETKLLDSILVVYPELAPYLEFVKQRDTESYDPTKLIELGTPRKLVSAILYLKLRKLYKEGRYTQAKEVFENHEKYAGVRSYDMYIKTLRKLGLHGRARRYMKTLVSKFPRSKLALEYLSKVNVEPSLEIKVFFYNRKYSRIVKKFKPNYANAYFLMSSYYKLRRKEEASRVCMKFRKTPINYKDYLTKCSIVLSETGRFKELSDFIRKLHEVSPYASSRIVLPYALKDENYRRLLFSLEDKPSEEFLFVRSMVSLSINDTKRAISYLQRIPSFSRSSFELSRAYYWLYKLTGKEEYKDSVRRVHPFGFYALKLGFLPEVVSAKVRKLPKEVEKFGILYALGFEHYLPKEVPRKLYEPTALLLHSLGFHDYAIYFCVKSLEHPVALDILHCAYPTPYMELFDSVSRMFGIPKALLYALVREESRFDTLAVSIAGARGIAQIMPKEFRRVVRKLKLENKPFSLEASLIAGGYLLKEYKEKVGKDWKYAIVAYNGGVASVRRWLKTFTVEDEDMFFELITYRETRNYFRKVMRSWKIYEFILQGTPR